MHDKANSDMIVSWKDIAGAIDTRRVQQWAESLDIHAHQPPLCDLTILHSELEELGMACAICE